MLLCSTSILLKNCALMSSLELQVLFFSLQVNKNIEPFEGLRLEFKIKIIFDIFGTLGIKKTEKNIKILSNL